MEHQSRGGKTVMENPWSSEAWNTQEMEEVLALGIDTVKIDMCHFGLKDKESGKLHRKSTCIASDSPGVIRQLQNSLCRQDHVHQPLEGSNCYGSRCRQAGKYPVRYCQRLLRGVQEDLQDALCHSFHAEELLEDREEEDNRGTLDSVKGPEDLGDITLGKEELPRVVEKEEDLELLDKESDPKAETLRKQEWRRLTKAERIGIRRLHHMASHATKHQMMRMLKYANAEHHVIKAVRHFRCPACDRIGPEQRPQVVKPPDDYVFNRSIGMDIITVKDALDVSYNILHIMYLGTCFHVAEVLGPSQGVPSSKKCLEVLLRSWIGWAGLPQYIMVDRGTHNRGIMMVEMEKRGCVFKHVALEAPYQLGKVERGGGVLKDMLKRVVNAETVAGELEMSMALAECLETKNRQGTVSGFSPSQWVIGRNPGSYGWSDENDDDFQVVEDSDPHSAFNRRAGFRESARLAWAMEDSHRRVRAAILRRGGAQETEYRPGDMVSFLRKQKTGGWIGPARALACEGKNLWLLHAGIPVLVASNRVRGANAEEHLEVELLQKHRLSRKRPFMDREAIRQPHRLQEEGQAPYVDMRPDAGPGLGSPNIEGDDSPKKQRRAEATPTTTQEQPHFFPPNEAPTTTSPQEPLLPQVPQHPELPQQEVRAEEVPIPEDDEILRDLDLLEDESAKHDRSQAAEQFRQSSLGKAIRDPSKLDDHRMARKERSRSPAEERKKKEAMLAMAQEFICFMAKRKGKPDSHEIIYSKSSEEMQQKLRESRAKEWSNWTKYQAVRFPEKTEVDALINQGYKAIPMRWVDVDKNEKLRVPNGPPVPEKLKSRLVIRGDLETESFRTDCPTASATSIHILLSYAACKTLDLRSGDITAAFLQGAPIERTLLMAAPKDGIPVDDKNVIEPYTYLVAMMSVYGSKDAPRGFWLELRKELLRCGLVEIDPAFYALVSDGVTHGLLCSHVDDLLWAGGELMDQTMKKVQERFTFGSTEEGSFRFCGRKIESNEEEFRVSSPETLDYADPS